ncbi:hypothetical protein NC652_019127 [Populus alba x Populus x berolinensis]|uniref:Uncharacterized protein n=2 Tax=Populus TaxID=3689 RepID=A0A4U5MAK4_POPAL|nr:hypothetical protein NC652_019127 [Populus alba x Populus x berolinensis]KAJ6990557.1 hypothetical protein NC653_018962 [Populus alba x Populus x berolinensis]TKR66131.1 hypothetical protein D5086_0000314770 [Populus alba]
MVPSPSHQHKPFALSSLRSLCSLEDTVSLSRIRNAAGMLLTLDEKNQHRIFEGEALLHKMNRFDSQKHIDFSLISPLGGGGPGRVKRKESEGCCLVDA